MHRLRTLVLALVVGAAFLALAGPAMASGGDRGDGAVYTLTNSASGNAVVVFERDRDGSLAARGRVATGGNGTGAGLGSQGALTSTTTGPRGERGQQLALAPAVARRGKFRLADVDPSAREAISVTVHCNFVYVLNGVRHDARHIRASSRSGQARPPSPVDPAVSAAARTGHIEFSPNGATLS